MTEVYSTPVHESPEPQEVSLDTLLGGSRNFTQYHFIFIQSSHKRRYSAHTATLPPPRKTPELTTQKGH